MKYIKIIFAGLFISCSAFPLWAKSGTTAAEFLKFPVGARASSMGEAFAGLANDSSAVYWNPAGLPSMSWTEMTATYSTWIEGISVGNFCCSVPLDSESSFGVGVTYFNFGSIDKTGINKSDLGTYTAGDISVTLGYGVKIDRDLSLGLSAKYISEKIDSESGSGFAADFGGLYSSKIGELPVNFGAVLSNIGAKMGPGEKSDPPTALNAGVTVKLVKDILNITGGVNAYKESDMTAGLGAEYLVSDIFTLRLGYKLFRDDLSGIEPVTAGFGIIYTEKNDFMLDYAFTNMGALGLAHKISVGVRL